jgi:hypothetical protein
MRLIGDLLILLTIAAAQLIVVCLAALIRRYVFRAISLAGALAISNAAIVLVCMALYPTDIFCHPVLTTMFTSLTFLYRACTLLGLAPT